MPENPIIPPPEKLFGGQSKTIIPPPDKLLSAKRYNEEGVNSYNVISKENADDIIDAIPEMPGDTESKKGLLKDLVKRGGTKEEISESILALQGKHPKQDGGYKYYMDEKGVARPLANSEKPPKGYDVASLFGSQKDAEDDNVVTSTAKHLWNGLVGAAEGVVSLPETIYGLSTGDESTIANTLKNSAQYLKFNTKSSEKEQLFDTKGMTQWTDILDPDRYTPSGDNIQGQILNGLESVISFAVGRGLGTAGKIGATGQKALTAMSAYNMSLNSMLDASDEAGLTGRDKYAFSAVASIPQAALEGFTGVGGLLTKNAAAKTEMANLARIAAKNLERDAAGNITKESLEKLTKEMTVASASVAKKYAGQVASTVGEEALTETAQQFAEESSKQLYDKLKQDPAFNADAFSAESLGKYVNAAIGGALGSIGPSMALNLQTKSIERDKAQKESVFDAVQKGDDAVKALKQNIYAEKANGGLTPQEADDAIIKVNAYKEYNDITTASGLRLDEEQKKESFDKTFQKQNIEQELEAMGDPSKLNPLLQGQYKAKEKIADDLQKDINEIILKAQIKKETTVGKKTIKDIAKSEEKPKEDVKQPVIPKGLTALADKYKKENKNFEDLSVEEYNDSKFIARDKHKATAKYLETLPDSRVENATVVDRIFDEKKNNNVFEAEMADGKKIRFASSMKREDKNGRGNLMFIQPKSLMKQDKNGTWEIDEAKLKNAPIGLKTYTVNNDGREKKVIKIFSTANNEDYGKFIGWAKETLQGKNDFTHKEINGEGGLIDIEYNVEKPLNPQAEKVINTPVKPLPVSNVQAIPTKEEFVSTQINNLLTAQDADVDQDLINNGTYQRFFENQYNKTYGKTTSTNSANEKEESQSGDNNQVGGDVNTESVRKETTLRKQRTKDIKIKDPSRLKALGIDVFTPYDIVMQYFIGGGKLNSKAFRGLYQTPAEIEANKPLGELKGRSNYVTPSSKVTVDSLAHSLWESNSELRFDTSDWKAAIEEVLNTQPASLIEMADNLIAKHKEKVQSHTAEEQELVDIAKKAEANEVLDEVNDGVENLEQLSDETLNNIADNESWEDINDIISNNEYDGNPFQKSKELIAAEAQLIKAEEVLKSSKKAFDAKRKELGKEINNDQEDLFGERKSEESAGLFDERVDMNAYESVIAPFKDRYDAAVKAFNKAKDKVKQLEGSEDNQTELFQKKSLQAKKEAVEKVVEKLRKVLPKGVKIEYDPKLKASGKWNSKTKTITINPFLANTDTAIHEIGHILIDAIGYNNKVIQAAIKQLEGTDLWKETAENYKLSDTYTIEDLGKEVLAEAIGREGAEIFDKASERSKFKALLDYIFDWFKRNLGLEKNIAKNLAKQVISGINIKVAEGKSANQEGEYLELVNGFYSPIEKQLKEFKLANQSATKWLNMFGKGDEVTFTGLRAFLEAKRPDEQVKKSEIQDYIKNNRIQIKEVVKGEDYKVVPLNFKKSKNWNFDDFEFARDSYFDYENGEEMIADVWEDDEVGYKIMRDANDIYYAFDEKGNELMPPEENEGTANPYFDNFNEAKEATEKALAEENRRDNTKFSQYQLEGEKENYKEVLITLPSAVSKDVERRKELSRIDNQRQLTKEEEKEYYDLQEKTKGTDKTFKSSHFDEANIVVHLRMNTRKDADGNKVLFLEEVQSDWGQKGKKEGFKTEIKELPSVYRIDKPGKFSDWTIVQPKGVEGAILDATISEGATKEDAIQKALNILNNRKSISSAPYVTDTNAWAKLGMKVALQHAVKEGATKIAWTTGEQQNERYDLSKQVNQIDVENTGNGVYFVDIELSNGSKENLEVENGIVRDGKYEGQQLDSIVGKEYAEKILSTPKFEMNSLKGEDLKLGGKGMIGFYGSPKQGSLGIIGGIAEKLFGKGSVKTTKFSKGNDLGKLEIQQKEGKWEIVNEEGVVLGKFSTEGAAKGKFKEIEKSQKTLLEKSNTEQYSVDITPEMEIEVGRGLAQFQKNKETNKETGKEQFQVTDHIDDLKQVVDALKDTELSDEEKAYLKELKSNIKEAIEDSEEMAQLDAIAESNNLEDFTLDELIEGYNFATSIANLGFGQKITKPVMGKIAYFFNENGKEVLRENEKFVETDANKKDLSWKDTNFKVLSHMTENFPELQQLSPLFDEAYFNKISEANTMKKALEKLAKAVISEHNKKLGLSPKRVLNFFSSDNARYFNYLDDGGQLRENTSGLSPAQIALLDHMRELLEKRNTQVDENGDLIQNEILKIDKGFAEEFKTEGLMSALSNYFGGSNLADAQIAYTNPKTKQVEESSYLDAQKEILSYSKAGLKEKAVGLAKLLSIAYKAKKAVKGKPAFALNYKGQLTNKFDKPRNKDLGYSKDFYRAAQMFIDDYTHVKYMSKFVPIVNSLDYLYTKGYGEVLKKPNAKRWLDEWSQAQIYQTEKTTDPIIDNSLKFLRTLTSQIVMGFNLVANIMNVAIGTYNTWRAENLATILKGNKRLFYKNGLSKQGIDLLDKYSVVNMDVDSNPGFSAGKLFQRLAFGGQKYGEMQIQGSAFLGKLSDKDWDSFERNDKGELVVKQGVDEEALVRRINNIKNEISDIQGKYSDKDRRNFARGEFGKNLAQFKTWMPDWWRIRYGAEYIDGNGKTQRGTWNMFTKDAMAEIKKDFSKENNYGFKMENGIPMLKNKQVASNLKGAMVVAFMLAATWGDDEDKNKRKQALSLQSALGNLLFIFDVDQMKYTLKNPVASIGTINKFIEVLDDVIKQDSDEFMKDAKKIIPHNKATDVPKQVEQIGDIVK